MSREIQCLSVRAVLHSITEGWLSGTPPSERTLTALTTPHPPGPGTWPTTSPLIVGSPQTDPRLETTGSLPPPGKSEQPIRTRGRSRTLRMNSSFLGTSEIGGVGILTRLDDTAPDGARAGKILHQVIAVTGADRALQREEFLGEATEDLQRGILVVEEHVAPHGRVAGRDPGEIAKPGGGILDDLAVGHPAQVIGHAHHRVGDQMRRMAGHRQHQVVMLGVHLAGLRAHLLPEPLDTCDGLAVTALDRHDQAPTVVEQTRKTRSRAGMLGARQRMGRDEMRMIRQMRGDRLDDGL